jgi:AP-5 complex subunit beta-1
VHIPFLLSVPSNGDTGDIGGEEVSPRQLQIVNHPSTTGLQSELTGISDQIPPHVNVAKGMDVYGNAPKLEPDKDGISISAEQIHNDAFKESIVLELEPKQPVPTIIDTFITASDEDGRQIDGQLDTIHIGIEDLFTRALVPSHVSSEDLPAYNFQLFNALWEAFDGSQTLHKSAFTLNGGKSQISLVGTESVKLLESQAKKVVDAVECHLAPYVISASGAPLVSILQESGIFKDVFWEENSNNGKQRPSYLAITYDHLQSGETSNQLYDYSAQRNEGFPESVRENIGSLRVLIFLPPRFHILFKMEVADWSTQVHIRTDHWPCLAYVDEYLEALITKKGA